MVTKLNPSLPVNTLCLAIERLVRETSGGFSDFCNLTDLHLNTVTYMSNM